MCLQSPTRKFQGVSQEASAQSVRNSSQKLSFQTSVLLPGPTPVSLVAQAKNVRVFSHRSLLKPTTKSCRLLRLKSALCCPSLFITTSNAFLGLSLCPGLLPHLDPHLGPCSPGPSPGPLLTWTLTWALAHLDPCSPGHSPGPLLTWGLLLTWTLTWTLAHLGSCSPGLLPASRLALLQCVFCNTTRMVC